MKKYFLTIISVFLGLNALAQTPEEFKQQYLLQTKVAGLSGLGVKTVLNSWEAAHPNDTSMLEAGFFYHLDRARGSTVVARPEKKYLGLAPALTLKDSTGKDVYYYELPLYEEEQFSLSQKYLDRAISLAPDNLSYRFQKITTLLDYEGESPDMAASALLNLIELNYDKSPHWNMDGKLMSGEDFVNSVKEYCYAFWQLGTPTGYESFHRVSSRMLKSNPKDVVFIDNLGSYWQVYKRDYKRAARYYKKALKIDPDDYAATHNLKILKKQKSR